MPARLTAQRHRCRPTKSANALHTLILLVASAASMAAAMDAAAASRAWLRADSEVTAWPPYRVDEVDDGAALGRAILWLDGWATAAADPRLRPSWWRHDCWQRYARAIDVLYRRLHQAPAPQRRSALHEMLRRRAPAQRLAPLAATVSIDPALAAAACDRHGHPLRLIAVDGLAERRRRGTLPAAWEERLASHHRAAIRQRFGDGAAAPGLTALLPVLRPLWRCFDEAPYAYTGPWVRLIDEAGISLARPQPVIDRGWLVGDNDRLIALRSWFGGIALYPADRYHVRRSDLGTAAELTVAARRALWQRQPDGYAALLPAVDTAAMTAEPPPATVAECLLAWACWRTGDRTSASRLLAPLADAVADDRQLVRVALPAYAERLRQQCITEWVQRGDTRAARRWAEHLAGPSLVGTAAGGWGAQLAADLAGRTGDYSALRLPSHRRWAVRRQRLPRAGQIRFLVERLRLLRQPSSFNGAPVDLRGPQWSRDGRPVINPYAELERLRLTIDERVALVDALACDRFVAIAVIGGTTRSLLRLAHVVAPLLHTDVDVDALALAGTDSAAIIRETLRAMIRAEAAD